MRNKLININKYVLINVHLFNIIELIIAIIVMKIYLINKFNIKMFIKTNVINFERIKLNLHNDIIIIDSCKNFVIKIDNKTRLNLNIKRIIRVAKTFNITFKLFKISIIFNNDLLLNDRDFLFKLQCVENFNKDNEILIYVIDFNLFFVQIYNIINSLILLLRRIKLNIIMKCDVI